MTSARSSFRALAAVLFAIAASVAQAQTLQKTALPIDGNMNGDFEIDETIQYTLTFTNTGATDLTNVVIRDESSGCIAIDGASVVINPTGGGTNNSSGNSVLVDVVSPLAPGQSVTITFVASATAIGGCCNQATWTSTEAPGGVSDLDPADATPDEATCHLVVDTSGPAWDAIIDKQVLSAGCIAPGSIVEFRVRIQNTGRRPLREVTFTDVLSRGFTDVVGNGLNYDASTNTLSTDPKTYGVGEETGWTYSATIPCTASGTLSNTATLTFVDQDGATFTRSDTETVTWGQPDISDSTKTWADDPTDGDRFVSPGENITFTIVVRNTGSCEALNVSVTDPLDPRFMSGMPPLVVNDGGVYNVVTSRIEWNETLNPQLAAIPPGGVVTLTFTTQVDPSTRVGDLLPNSVTISPMGGDTSCSGFPSVTRTIAMQNGDIPYGVAPTTILLRNDFVSCRASAFDTMAGEAPDGIPVLQVRPEPQVCSTPPAINAAHPQTDVIVNPVSPFVFADAAWTPERCPQVPGGSGRVLIFYELQDDCTDTLRVIKDPLNAANVLVSW